MSPLLGGQTVRARHACVGDVMLTTPTVHDASVPVTALRRLFFDDHVHIALLVDAGRLVAAVERDDLADFVPGTMPARAVGRLGGRTIRPDASLSEAVTTMRLAARRRLAVVDARTTLLGLLCIKASGDGFCSNRDVRERREQRPACERATRTLRDAS